LGLHSPRRLYKLSKAISMGKKRKDKVSGEKPKSKIPKRLLRFYILFGLLILIIGILYPVMCDIFKEPLSQFMALTATLTGGLLKVLGGSVTVSGRFISFRGFSVEIVYECLGIVEMLYFTAAVFAFPSDLKKKLQGILIFFPIIFVANILRCAVLVYAGDLSTSAFHFIHIYFFQIAMILFIAIFWLIWLKKVVRYEGKSA